MKGLRPSIPLRRGAAAVIALCAGAVAAGQARAGGLISYEVGTADVGLASLGYSARVQDASTVLTNPAGMTRLGGRSGWFRGRCSGATPSSPSARALHRSWAAKRVVARWDRRGGSWGRRIFQLQLSPAEYLCGAGPDSNLDSRLQVALGGCGDVVCSFDDTATLFLAANFNWKF